MKYAATKFTTKMLNSEQKQSRMDVAQQILTTFNDDPDLLEKVNKNVCIVTLIPKANHTNGSVKRAKTVQSTFSQ